MITYSLNTSNRDSIWGLCPWTRENTSSWMAHFKKWEDILKMGLRTIFFGWGGQCYNYSNFIFLFTDKNIKMIFRIPFVSLLLLPAMCLSVPLTKQWALQGCRCESIFIWKMFSNTALNYTWWPTVWIFMAEFAHPLKERVFFHYKFHILIKHSLLYSGFLKESSVKTVPSSLLLQCYKICSGTQIVFQLTFPLALYSVSSTQISKNA